MIKNMELCPPKCGGATNLPHSCSDSSKSLQAAELLNFPFLPRANGVVSGGNKLVRCPLGPPGRPCLLVSSVQPADEPVG